MTDELESLAAEAEQQDSNTKAGEYQPGPETQKTGAGAINTGEMISGLLMITFNQVLAPRRGKHWELPPLEGQALGEAYGEVLDKYFPDLNGGCELTAIALTLAVVGPRMMQDRAVSKAAEQETSEGGDNGDKSE